MRLEYHPLSISDLSDAVAYYNQQRSGLGNEFRAEIYDALERISDNPFQYAVVEVEKEMRRCLVHRFPYSILFRCPDEETVWIDAIRHNHRHPSFGLNRK